MKTDEIFRATADGPAEFEFNEQVAEVFDDMLVRSVPQYSEQQRMVGEMAAKFWIPGTGLCDLGCSTGTTLRHLAAAVPAARSMIGYDNSWPMIEKARAKIRHEGLQNRIGVEFGDLNSDLEAIALANPSVVTLCWTLQFVRPLNRGRVIRWIHENLADGGVLIVTEKILTASPHINRFFIDLYHEFKARNHYTPEEIRRKREALENVLIPYRAAENLRLFRKSGFEAVETFFQWYNFAGFLCVKRPGSREEPRTPLAPPEEP